jgi:hypothetical protein
MELGLCFSRGFPKGEQSELLTHIATTVNASLYTPMKSLLPSWNWKERFVSAY